MIQHIRRLLSGNVDDGGASTVEYGLLTATIAAMVVGMVAVLGLLATDGLAQACDTIGTASGENSPTCAADIGSSDSDSGLPPSDPWPGP